MAEWVITTHAIDQYISRWCEPNKDRREANNELLHLLQGARPSHKAEYGGQIWLSGLRPEVRLLIKDVNVLVTVLPPDTKVDLTAEWMEHYQSQIEMAQAEIDGVKALIEQVNHKRKALGEEKNRLMMRLQDAENRIKALRYIKPGD